MYHIAMRSLNLNSELPKLTEEDFFHADENTGHDCDNLDVEDF